LENVKYSDYWKEKGNEHYKLGNYIEAVNCYRRAIEINPDSDKARHNLAMAYNQLSKNKDSDIFFGKSGEIISTTKNQAEENRHGLLNPLTWTTRFVVVGLLIWTIKIVSGSNNPALIAGYYLCAIAAMISLCLFVAGVVKFIARRYSSYRRSPGGIPVARRSNPLSSSAMNVRTWVLFYLICFVALLWAVFLHDQGMMLWVGAALVMIVVGFNLLFIFRR
jgi:hypothetical protein